MIVTTHQPFFLPWPGFFFKALQADAMVLLDEVQFPLGRGWMNRNRLKSEQGELWLTVPVWKKGRGMQIIREVEICDTTDWRRIHLRGLRQNYAHAPYRKEYLPAVETIYERGHRRLVELNLALIRFLWEVLGLKSRLLLQSELKVHGQGSELLVSVCRALGADGYLTLPIVEKYLDQDRFQRSGVKLIFAPFSPPVYPQLWGEPRYNLSTLDMLLNCGSLKGLEILTASVRDFAQR
jgi:hypothetical protein